MHSKVKNVVFIYMRVYTLVYTEVETKATPQLTTYQCVILQWK